MPAECTLSVDELETTCQKDSITPDNVCYVKNMYYTGIMTKKGTINNKPYWTIPNNTYGVWHDSGSGSSADWVMGSIRYLGTDDDGDIFSNVDAESPDRISTWYPTNLAGSRNYLHIANSIVCNVQQITDDEDFEFEGSADSIDVCAYPGLTQCDTNAICNENGDKYTCKCGVGFLGNGTSCAGKKISILII